MDSKHIKKRLSKLDNRINELDQLLSSDLENLKVSEGISLNVSSLFKDQPEPVDLESYRNIRSKVADEQFVEQLKEYVSDIPKSNGSSYYSKIELNIGIVMDEFLYHSYENTANFFYVTPENYKEIEKEVTILLVASAWKGLGNEWVGLGNLKNKKVRSKMFEVISYFQSKNKKTIFYSKEDPTNYEFFVEIASKCDYIFTTAVEKIPHYKRDCKNDQVFLLEFGVNPTYNNPIGLHKHNVDQKVVFAGSWYRKYPNRQKDTRKIFDGVITAGKDLKIIDRNYSRDSESFLFPTEYLKYVSPAVQHDMLQLLSKLYTWSINLNSIQESMTMFASRVYELQSMGNLILSNYSLGVNNLFPNVFMIFNSNEVDFILNHYSELEKYQLQMFGVRKVLRSHTTYHRLASLLKNIGFEQDLIFDKSVAVVCEELSDQMIEQYNRQTYKMKTLLTLDQLNEKYSDFDYIAFMSDEYEYGEFYLEDMINGFKYTNSTFITKDSYFSGLNRIAGIENDYVNRVSDYKRTLFSLAHFSVEELLNIKNLKVEKPGYSIDSLELNVLREIKVIEPSKPKFSVIVAAYNNGDHLYSKCFMSLRRSSMFNEMEVIIVDDGSTDDYTPKIVSRLARLYPNVKAHFYKDGGSGSASRPRNKGVLMASTEYVTYLDPDNEAINDGYTKLYQSICHSDVDVVIGNIIKVDTNDRLVDYYKAVKEKYPTKDIFGNRDSRELFIETSFKVQSIQAMLIKRTLLLEKDLKMLVGVVGEDTIFFYDVLLHAKNFTVINETIHLYYAGVEGSAVNNVSARTFMKYKELEDEKILFLEKNHLLHAYMQLRFEYYFKNWYMKKLELVKEEERKESEETLYQIYQLYEQHLPSDLDETIKKWVTLVATSND
ncbi:glycosyltransferase [Metabacillus litoralis]|uniref:glycosyltransferase n=1 Tax=Metabacillus litoralis TaxID=152268 RepID=UPI001CFF2A75|nr:glycosyltransferase [Metabacillus litoralis]